MNDTISTFGFLSAWVSEHLTSQNTKYWANLEYQYNTAALVLVGVPLLVALAILLRDLSINSITRAEIESHPPAPELRAQAQSHQSTRPTAPQCSNVATQTLTTEGRPTSGSGQEEHGHQRVRKLNNDYIQQRAEWIVERQGLRLQLLQARRRIEFLLKANQIEIRTRAGAKFLAALKVVDVQEDIARFSAREKRKTEAFKKKLQLEYDQRLEQITIARSATANAERNIRMQAEENARVLTGQRNREGQQLAQASTRLQELNLRYLAKEQELSTELTRLRDELAVASQQKDKLLEKQEKTPETAEPICAGFDFGMRRASSAILSPSRPIDPAVQQPRADPSAEFDTFQQAPSRQPNSFRPPVDISSNEEEAASPIQVPSSPSTPAPISSPLATSGQATSSAPTANQDAKSSPAHAQAQRETSLITTKFHPLIRKLRRSAPSDKTHWLRETAHKKVCEPGDAVEPDGSIQDEVKETRKQPQNGAQETSKELDSPKPKSRTTASDVTMQSGEPSVPRNAWQEAQDNFTYGDPFAWKGSGMDRRRTPQI